jgi:hypothetical protein
MPLKTARHRGISPMWLSLCVRDLAREAPFRQATIAKTRTPPRFPWASFDHLVGGDLQSERHFEAKRLGCPEINHQLDSVCLDDRKFCRLRAL